jgi:acetylornithine/succinyldiaminopimelate/putrescine aminotransferase
MVGVTLEEGRDAREVAAACLEAGLVLNVPGKGMLRFLPPLVIGEDEMTAGIEILRHACG